MAGGVALNCVANGILMREKIFEMFGFNQPLETRVDHWSSVLRMAHHAKERKISHDFDKMKGSYLGPQYNDNEIESELSNCGANFRLMKINF